MDIRGPVASTSPPPQRRVGGIAGCLTGCLGSLGAAVGMLMTVVGGAWEITQPHHTDRVRVDDGTCEVAWWRSALGDARYRISCDAKRPLDLERFKLLSGPKGVQWVESVEDWGQRPWEDQRPMSGETVHVEGGRSWYYDGRISLGPVPWVGPAGEVRLTMVVDDRPVTLRATERP